MFYTFVITLQWDRYGKTGCFNLDCPGFVVDKGATILPGSRLQLVSHPYGVKRTITLSVLKVIFYSNTNHSHPYYYYLSIDFVPYSFLFVFYIQDKDMYNG